MLFEAAVLASNGPAVASKRVVCQSVRSCGRASRAPLSVWNLLVQPHVKKFHRGLETLQLRAHRLSSVSEKLAFREELWTSLLKMSEVPQLHCTKRSGESSSIGVMDGKSLHAM